MQSIGSLRGYRASSWGVCKIHMAQTGYISRSKKTSFVVVVFSASKSGKGTIIGDGAFWHLRMDWIRCHNPLINYRIIMPRRRRHPTILDDGQEASEAEVEQYINSATPFAPLRKVQPEVPQFRRGRERERGGKRGAKACMRHTGASVSFLQFDGRKTVSTVYT